MPDYRFKTWDEVKALRRAAIETTVQTIRAAVVKAWETSAGPRYYIDLDGVPSGHRFEAAEVVRRELAEAGWHATVSDDQRDGSTLSVWPLEGE